LTGGTLIVIGLAAGVGLLIAVGVYEEMLGQLVKKNRQSVNAELAQFCERLAMMCLAGSSASSALLRIGAAGDTALRRAVARAVERTKNGMGLADALKHETAMFNAPGLDRVIRLIAAQHETPNLAQLLQQQAALQRSEAHRQLIADLDKRSQAVWIPVTVATLVPGVIFLAIPFLSALQPLNN
jgi:type II secretory pathway component PulF